MVGECAAAKVHAQNALEQHLATGDRYLESLALILLGRIAHEDGEYSRSEQYFRECEAVGIAIGSGELAGLGSHYIVRSLVLRGVPSGEQWDEAYHRVQKLLNSGAEYEFSRAEFLIMRARLHALQLDFESAEADLAIYEELARTYQNRVGLANALKERARLQIGVARSLWTAPNLIRRLQSSSKLAESMVLMARSRALYLEGELPTAAGRAQSDQALIASLLGRTSEARALLPTALASANRRSTEALTMAALHLLDGNTDRAAEALDAAEVDGNEVTSLERVAVHLGRSEVASRRSTLTSTADSSAQRKLASSEALAALQALEPIRSTMRTGIAGNRLAEMTAPIVADVLDRAVGASDHDAALEANEFSRSIQLAGLLREGRSWALPPKIRELLDELDQAKAEAAEQAAGRPLVGRLLQLEMDGRSPIEIARSLADRQSRLHRELATETSAEFANLYDPARPTYSAVLDSLPGTARVLALQVTPGAAGSLTRIWRTPTGAGGADHWQLTEERLRAIGLLSTANSGNVQISQLGPLRDLIPSHLLESLIEAEDPPPLLIVPSGPLWGVAYPALPVLDGRPLIDFADPLLCPSLSFQALLSDREETRPGDRVAWIDPHQAFDLDRSLVADLGYEVLERVSDVRTRVADSSVNAVLASHGNQDSGLAHGLLEPDGTSVYLRASDFITHGSSPNLLVMAACSGAFVPGDNWSEPLGLATAALCMGTKLVVASVGRVGLDKPTSEFLGKLYAELTDGLPSWRAVAKTQRDWVSDRGPSSVLQWGTICSLGSY